jgi:hypothetical protein
VTTRQAIRRSEPRKAKKPELALQNNSWRLPSGKRLAEFALASGFLAPPLMENGRRRGERKAS